MPKMRQLKKTKFTLKLENTITCESHMQSYF